MSERKNLDKLFQEKFKDFEAAAPEESWPYIEEKLKEKKKRRVIPIWWKLSGVAAVLLIGLLISDGFFNRGSENNNGIVVRDNQPSQNNSANPVENAASGQTAVATAENPESSEANSVNSTPANEVNSESTNSGIVSNDKVPENKNANVHKNIPIQKQPKAAGRVYEKEQQLVSNDNAPDNANTSNKNRTVKNQKTKINAAANQQLATSSQHKTKGKSGHLKASQAMDKNNPLQNTADKKSQTNLSATDHNDSKIAQQNSQQSKTGEDKTQPANNKQAPQLNNNQQTQLAQNENKKPAAQEKKLDSTAIANVEPNALEKLLNEKENNLVTKEPHINRWQITSSVAPIYFGSTSGGSPIDTSFAGNSKSYKTNMSVKLGVNYAVNKRLSIRTGVSQVTLDYNTNDVYVYAGMERNSLGNVDTNGQNQFLHFAKSARKKAESRSAAVEASIATNLATDEFASEINQRMGYIEVPLELSYTLIDKKIGINLIGGLSTLFLNENKITVVSDGLTTNLGEANNLNKTHFSTNVGVGVRYRFFKAFQANFEPMFKYQINTFSKGDGNFKPYFLGLYTGVSYSF